MAKTTKKAAVATVQTFDATQKNRDRRLAKHLKKHPKDAQAVKASGTPAPVRKKPVTKGSVSKSPVTRVIEYHGDIGFLNARASIGYHTEGELFHRGRMKPQDYEAQVRKMRQPTADILKATQGKFGLVRLNLFGVPYNRKDTEAVCHQLRIKFKRSK